GLSRMDQVAPDQLVTVLGAARSRPWFTDWYNALPIAGQSDRMVGGTLRSRMRGTPAAGNVHAKTGSLTGVSALSGYVTTANGQQWVFSMVSNNAVGVNLKGLEDTVAVRLAEEGSDTRTGARVRVDQRDTPELECSWEKSC